jgi:transposase
MLEQILEELLSLRAEVILLRAENASLRLQVSSLTQEVSSLTYQLEQSKIKKNSHNSSIPPSQDISRKNTSLRTSSGKPIGGQLGHEGKTLLFDKSPTDVIDLMPTLCSSCGESLASTEGVFTQRRQLIDIPPVQISCTEYRQFSKQCSCCGNKEAANFPKEVSNYIQYGTNIQTMAVYNWQHQYLPFKRLQQWFYDIFSLKISKGTLENMIRRVASSMQPSYQQIQQQIALATCVGADETGVSINGKNNWIWVWQNEFYTFLSCSASRGFKTIEALFPEGFINAILVSDRWKAQLATNAASHQLCLAHLLRDTNYVIDTEPSCNFATDLKALFQQAIAQKNSFVESSTENITCKKIEAELDKLLAQNIDPTKYPNATTLQKSLINYRNYVFKFLYHQEVPFENNASERSIRMIKVKEKISGGFKSLQDAYCTIKSVVDTATKNEINPYITIKTAVMKRAG